VRNLVDELTQLVTYYEAKMTGAQIDLYIDALSDIEPEILHTAITNIVKNSKWMPKISEIRQAAQAAQETRDTAEVMDWHEERNTAKAASPWRTVMPWDRQGGPDVPAVIKWRKCEKCGVLYGKVWDDCPECTRVEAQL
jgi:hypothetical protein